MKKKIIAGLLATAAVAFAGTGLTQVEAATTETYRPSGLFLTESSELTSKEIGEETYLAVALKDNSSVTYRQNLALAWMESAGEEGYFTLELQMERNFTELKLTLESDQNSATKDKKTTNVLTFTKTGVIVNDGTEVAFTDTDVTVTLRETETTGDFTVFVNGRDVGEFTNIGGYYAPYRSSSATTPCVPLRISAETEDGAVETLAIKSMNKQSFALTDGNIVDDTAPVFVLGEEVRSFLLGYTVALDYVAIDVCDETVTKTLSYLQYGKDSTSTLSSSTLIFETDVFDTYGCEYINVTGKLNDDSGNTAEIDLSWYADEADLTAFDDKQFFSVVRNSSGPQYVGTESEYEAYQEAVTAAAEGVSVGESSYVYLPSLKGMIEDDDTAYESFSFTVYYKTQTSSSVQTASGLKSDSLYFSVSDPGKYVFKVVVSDKTGNALQAEKDGKDVTVTYSNVFEIDSIPSFTFTIYNYGVSVENGKTNKTGYVDATYNISNFTINAVSGYEASYKLFYVDTARYYEEKGEYLGYNALVDHPTDYADYFVEIDEYNSAITEDDEEWSTSDNEYNWQPSSLTFVPQKTGFYVVEAEVTDAELYGVKDFGYQAIEIVAEQDIVKGDSDWLENNIVSVVLFAIAAVALLGIIAVVVIDPKEKDLDEIDQK